MRVLHVSQRHPDAAYVARPSIFGNPYPLRHEDERALVIGLYRTYFLSRVETDPEFRAAVEGLRGKDLVCFCAPKPCHADVILEYLS